MILKDKEIQSDMKKGSGDMDENDNLAMYRAQAEYFRSLEQQAIVTTAPVGGQEEEKKGEEVKSQKSGAAIDRVDLGLETERLVATQPWMKALADNTSDVAKMITSTNNHFNKKSKDLLLVANLLGVSDKKVEGLSEIPLVEGNKGIQLAFMFQNVMQPKNHQRREAIDSKHYKEILTEDDA